nr:hypothetical protein [Tanacetum cinerariifolium]
MKKLKENVHAIQVGCKICEGANLDKDCSLNEEVKGVEEVKYGEVGKTFPNNGRNGTRYRMGPPRYYTRTENRPPFKERITSLEETINNDLKESDTSHPATQAQPSTAQQDPRPKRVIRKPNRFLD